jgi:hypothetical protein
MDAMPKVSIWAKSDGAKNKIPIPMANVSF